MISHYHILSIVENVCNTAIVHKKYASVEARNIYTQLCVKYLKMNYQDIGDTIGISRFTTRLKNNDIIHSDLYKVCDAVVTDTVFGLQSEKIKLQLYYDYKLKQSELEHIKKINKITKDMFEFEELLCLDSDVISNFIKTRLVPYLKFHKK